MKFMDFAKKQYLCRCNRMSAQPESLHPGVLRTKKAVFVLTEWFLWLLSTKMCGFCADDK
jgi:hypothetical protein